MGFQCLGRDMWKKEKGKRGRGEKEKGRRRGRGHTVREHALRFSAEQD